MSERKDLDAAEIDTMVGDRIRRRRILLGFTQDQLGEALGISYQQIQKYETGANRVSAGRLFQIAERLQTHVGWFFEGVGEQVSENDDEDMSSPRHVIELVRGFSRISEDKLRMAVLSLVRAMADSPEDDDADSVPDHANGGAQTSQAEISV
ncbi:MAG: helix-turn-helix transcriptional regulator [Pseudomonadota bacterium]